MSTQITNIPEFTDYWKKRYPSLYRGKSDEEVIGLVKERHPDLNLPTYEEALKTDQSQLAPEVEKSNGLDGEQTDPSWVDSWWLTGDIVPDKWQTEGALGGLISADFFKRAYNDSMAGMLYKTVHGKDKWTENPGYDPSWYAQAGQFAVGMLSPLDAGVMVSTGSLGKLASAGGKSLVFGRGAGKKFLQNGLLGSAAKKYPLMGSAGINVLEGALSLGIGGGSFSAAHALFHETARQRTENEDGVVNIKDALKVASDEFLHALPMFAIAGGVTQGLMGPLYGYAQAYMKEGAMAQKLTLAATHPISRVGTEAALFTSLPSMLGDEEAPKLGSKEWWASLGTNTLIVGAMRAIGGFTEDPYIDAKKLITNEIKLSSSNNKKVSEVLKNVNENVGDVIIKDIRDATVKLKIEESKTKKDIETITKDIDFIQNMNRLTQDPEYLKKTRVEGSKEYVELGRYFELANEYALVKNGIIEAALADEGKLKEHYKDQFGVEPTKTELLTFRKQLEQFKSATEINREWANDYMGGNWTTSTDGVNGGSPGTPNTPVLRTRIGGKTRQEARKWKDKKIIEEAKRLGVEYELTPKKKVKNKEQVIEDIFNQEKTIFEQKKLTTESQADVIVGKLKGGATYPQIENIVIKEKLLEKGVKGSKELLGISDVNKNILTYILDRLPETRKHTRGAKEVNKLAKYVEKKYKRNLNELTPDELVNLAKEYIQNRVGAKVYDKSNLQLSKKYSDAQIRKFKRDADYIRDSIGELFTFGELDKVVGSNIVEKVKKFNVRSVEKITIQGGEKGFNKWINYVKTKADKVIEYIAERRGKPTKKNPEGRILKDGKAKTITKEGAELAIKTARLGETRPTEIAKLKVKDILLDDNGKPTGEIRFERTKQKGAATKIDVLTDKKLAQKLYNYAKKNKKGPNDKIFPFESAKGFNAFVKLLSDKSGTKVELRIEGVPSPMGAGREYGRVFKTKFKGEKSVKETEISAKQYLTEGTKERRAARELSEIIYKEKADKVARDKFIKTQMKKNNLTKEQLKREGLSEGVFGEFAEGIIKLQKGVWQPSDFFHENLHRLKAFARLTNNKKLEKLISRGEKLAINTKEYKDWKKKNLDRDVEEFLADIVGGKASRMEFQKGILGKVNQFVKQLVSRVKVAFGVGNFNDIARVLSKRVQKGFSTEGVKFAKGEVKYKMQGMTEKEAYGYTKKVIKSLLKENEFTDSKGKEIVRHVAELSGLGENFKLKKDTPVTEMQQLVATINSMEPAVLRAIPGKSKWWKNFKDAEKLRLVKNITEADRKALLNNLQVKDGSIYKATNQQLKDFIEIVNTMDDVKNSTTTWIDRQVAEGRLNKKVADRFQRISKAKWAMPVTAVLESVGLKTLADKLFSHTSAELKYIGNFTRFETEMRSVFWSSTTGNTKWNKIKDMAYLFDKQRYFERLDKGYLTRAEKRFINAALDTKTWQPKNTKEGLFLKEHRKLMKEYKEAFIGEDGALRQVLNKAEFEKFINDKNINWINETNNVYVQRRLTKEFKKYYDPNGRHFEKLVEDQVEGVAKKMAKRYFDEKKIKNPKKEQMEKKMAELHDDAVAMAHGEIYELFEFNPGKYSPSFLKERHVKLPEKIKLDNKMVDVYETKFDLTTKDYAINQAKFLANVEFFPEFVKLKGFNRPGAKQLLGELKMKDPALADWTHKRIKDHLKIDKAASDYPNGIRILKHTTSLAAKFQLSFPTSGLKNFLIGTSQSLLAFRFRDVFMGFVHAIHKDNRALVRATGATEIGMRHFEMKGLAGGIHTVGDKFFKLGLMKPSENLNRYVSVLASRRDQMHLARKIKFSKEGSRSYNAAVNKLKSFYKLSDAEILLLKKYGMEGVKGYDAKAAFKDKRALDALYQKMNTYAHINTQGAAINIFMPDWAAGDVAQSALLYKRMAYAATANTTRNMKIAIQNGSMLQPIMFGLGAYFSGEALLTFYDKVLGQSPPKENSTESNVIKTALWKGEFLGIMSDFLSPFGAGKDYIGTSMYPSLLSTASVMWGSVMSVAKGEKFMGQGAEDFLTASSGLINNTNKLLKQGLLSPNSYPSQAKRYRKLYKDMHEEYGNRDEVIGLSKVDLTFQDSKYMIAFKNIFDSGFTKDSSGNSLGKWYMMCLFAKANDYYYTKITEDGTPIKSEADAIKYAVKSMKTSLTNLNPNKAFVTAKKGTKAYKNQVKKADMFLQWLNRGDKKLSSGLEKLNSQYAYRVNLLGKSLKEYIKSANLKKDLKYYNISISDLLFK